MSVVRGHLVEKCPHCAGSLVRRSVEQNARLHALLSNIATQKQWAGQWLDVEDWKRLIMAGFERASGSYVRVFPSIEGSGIDVLYRRTSRMSKQEMTDLIEYATSWALQQGVRLQSTPPLETLSEELARMR